MDKMSLFSILTVSVPETILNIYIGFVLTGQRNKLYLDDSSNIIRLFLAVITMVITAVLTRSIFSNMILVLLSNILIYIIILKLIYNLKWTDSALSVVIFMGILITIELMYLLQFLMIVNKSLNSYYSDEILRFITSIPERIIQLVIIISFWKWDLVYLNIRNNKKLLINFSILGIALILSETIFGFVFIYNFDLFSLPHKIACISVCFIFALVNYLICQILITLTKKSIE